METKISIPEIMIGNYSNKLSVVKNRFIESTIKTNEDRAFWLKQLDAQPDKKDFRECECQILGICY